MIEVQQHTGKVRVEEYGLAEFMKQVQDQIQKGYEIDFSTNEGYPTSFTSFFTCLLTKPEDVAEVPAKDSSVSPPEAFPLVLSQDLAPSTETAFEGLPAAPTRIDGRTKQAKAKVA